MLDLLLVGVLYGIGGILGVVVRRISFSKTVKLHGRAVKWGATDWQLGVEESYGYFDAVGALLVTASLIIGFVGTITQYSNPILTYVVDIPLLVMFCIILFTTRIVSSNGLTMALPMHISILVLWFATIIIPVAGFLVFLQWYQTDVIYAVGAFAMPLVVGIIILLMNGGTDVIFGTKRMARSSIARYRYPLLSAVLMAYYLFMPEGDISLATIGMIAGMTISFLIIWATSGSQES